jgi:AbrB family looped-hinge helix DNA binding protein
LRDTPLTSFPYYSRLRSSTEGCLAFWFSQTLLEPSLFEYPKEHRSLTEQPYDDMMIDHALVGGFDMATTTISPKFQIVIPKEVREKLHLSPQQRLQVVEKGGVITLVPELPLKALKGALKGMSKTDIREKKDRP